MPDIPSIHQLQDLFRETPVMPMADLERAISDRSRRSLYRDLTVAGYLSSYTHTGRFYTLRSVPDFVADGLWQYQGIGFSRDGTLKATVWRLADTSEAGRTHQELRLRLGVRVHNPLRELVEDRKIGREPIPGGYVYVARARRRARRQLSRRRALAAMRLPITTPPLEPALEIEVLHEVIHGTVVRLDAQAVAARLVARGVAVTAAQVEGVFRRHGVEKKGSSAESVGIGTGSQASVRPRAARRVRVGAGSVCRHRLRAGGFGPSVGFGVDRGKARRPALKRGRRDSPPFVKSFLPGRYPAPLTRKPGVSQGR